MSKNFNFGNVSSISGIKKNILKVQCEIESIMKKDFLAVISHDLKSTVQLLIADSHRLLTPGSKINSAQVPVMEWVRY